jgi:hypothetical protein
VRCRAEERHTASELAAVRRLLQASGSLPTCEINLEYWVANATSRAVAARLVIANNRELRTDHWQVVYCLEGGREGAGAGVGRGGREKKKAAARRRPAATVGVGAGSRVTSSVAWLTWHCWRCSQVVYRYLDYQKLKLSSVTGAIALGMGSTSGAPVRLVDAFEEGAGIAAGGSYAFGANAALVAPPAGGNESLLIQGVNVNGLQCSQLAPAQEDRLPYRACAAALSSTAAPGGGDACRAEFCCGYILKDPSAVPPPAPAAPPPPPPPPQQLLLLPPADTAPPAVEDPGASEVGAGLPPVGASPAPDNSNDGGDRSLLQQPSPPPAGGVAPLVGGVVGAAAALAAAVAATAVILARRQKARAVADAAPAAVAAAAATEAAAPAKPPPPPERSRSGASTLASALARGSLGTLTLRHVTAGGGRAAHRGGSEGGSGADSPGEGGARSGRGTPSSAAAMPELPQEVTLFEQLGSGAFGTVYRGEWQGSRVAVKVLTTACATSSRELDSFRQEVAVLSRLRHPHIVAFLAACTVPPNICIIEELAEGGSLHARLHGRPGARRAAPLPLAALLQIAADVAEALVYLHPRIVHRDLKAQNGACPARTARTRGPVCARERSPKSAPRPCSPPASSRCAQCCWTARAGARCATLESPSSRIAPS